MTFSDLLASGRVSEDVPLAQWTTYKRGGSARYLFEAETTEDLASLAPVDLPVLVLGRGSNLVVADEGFDGLVVRLAGTFTSSEVGPDGSVVAGAAVGLPALARQAARAGRSGLEWMVGVPGSVGGAVAMNAGCFGTETADVMASAVLVDLSTGTRRVVTPSDLDMSYRHSEVRPPEVVASATFTTRPGSVSESDARMREITRWRRDHQPGGTYNAGSVFKNPPGGYAGEIIDRLGLKGMRVGGVAVSEKHANFFVADADATARDIHDLIAEVRRRVHEETGILLEPEIRLVGFS